MRQDGKSEKVNLNCGSLFSRIMFKIVSGQYEGRDGRFLVAEALLGNLNDLLS